MIELIAQQQGVLMLRRYEGSVLLGVGVLALVAALTYLFQELLNFSDPIVGASLPLVAIGGVTVLILLLTVVAMIFSMLGLANKDQAMGLPEGSIRAVIAVSLIVIFAILSVFLYKSVLTGSPINTIDNLSDMERMQFIRDHTTARDVQAILLKDADGTPLKNADGTAKNLYKVMYRSANAASEDFAKQLLVLLGTLMTAITSFYLGAGTATSAAAAGQTSVTPKPTVSSISPTSFAISAGTVHLDITGADLNIITNVKIFNAGVQFNGTNVSSNANRVTCDIDVSKASAGSWDVVVDDGGSKSATLPRALTLT